jgi:hypothetical protein
MHAATQRPFSPQAGIDQLREKDLLTEEEALVLQGLLPKAGSASAVPPSTAVKDIDAMLKRHDVHSPVAIVILKTMRYAAAAQAQAESQAPTTQNLLSIPDVVWEEASEGAVEGGGLGAIAGAEVGAAAGGVGAGPGAFAGAIIGAFVGGAVRGWGAWMGSGSTNGGKK